MRCVKCQSLEDKVLDSRMSKDGSAIRRRRECLGCGHRFTTFEQLEQSDFRVVKRDGTREAFSREKLYAGLLKACEKRAVPTEILEKAADQIVRELKGENLKEIESQRIGPLVMKQLRDIDSVAYVRYASVYRQFEDVGEFIEEIQSLSELPDTQRGQKDLFLQES